MFGDGASNTGNFGETMNLAALWRLPVVFILENNLYGMGTSVERHSAVTDFSKKAEGLGVPGVRADGMDVLAMRETVAEHIRIAREERRPTMVEAFTYRFRGHSAADPEVYRTKEEVAEWRKKDPIEVFADRLEAEGVLADGARDEMRERIEERVVAAVEFADSSPEPPLDTLYDHLYVVGEQVPGWYAVDERAPQPFAGEREGSELTGEAKRLAEAGAAYGGQAASTTGREDTGTTEDREGADALEDREEFIQEDEESDTQGPW
jgi:TPP-dependent pyruvate/acetoin dehydrogenase alpha subunit